MSITGNSSIRRLNDLEAVMGLRKLATVGRRAPSG
jgi:hypothetical protein